MTELYHCQQKIKHLTQQIRNSHDMVEFTLKQQVKDSERRLKEDLRRRSGWNHEAAITQTYNRQYSGLAAMFR